LEKALVTVGNKAQFLCCEARNLFNKPTALSSDMSAKTTTSGFEILNSLIIGFLLKCVASSGFTGLKY
jgi:hypothetical protein